MVRRDGEPVGERDGGGGEHERQPSLSLVVGPEIEAEIGGLECGIRKDRTDHAADAATVFPAASA